MWCFLVLQFIPFYFLVPLLFFLIYFSILTGGFGAPLKQQTFFVPLTLLYLLPCLMDLCMPLLPYVGLLG
jgi:hypothetical protein